MRHFHSFFLLVLSAFVLDFAHAQPLESNSTDDSRTSANPAIQDHMDRFINILNGAEPYNETEYAERFRASFISAVPLEAGMLPIIDALRQTADTWVLLGYDDVESVTAAVAVIAPEDTEEPLLALEFSIDPTDGNKVDGFLIRDAEPTLENPPATVLEAVNQLKALGQNLNYLVADAGNDEEGKRCNILAGEGVDQPAPMGSMFKFWVLGAVVDAIKDTNTNITWDQLVYIADEARSLPSGIVQNDPPGSYRTVRELAELMISISDNTATDLLLGLVGRSAVEQALERYGHHSPDLNRPFLTTKEMFLLKLDGAEGNGQPGPKGQQYLDGDEAERRAILDGLENETITSYDLDYIRAWSGGPIVIEDIEWFGSPLDLCNVLVRLYENEEVARILSVNPGVPDEQGIWSYIGFKGGSEPGVLGMAWYLAPADTGFGHRVVTGTLWDTVSAIDETQAALLFGALRDLSLSEDFESVEVPSESEDPDAPSEMQDPDAPSPDAPSPDSSVGSSHTWIHSLLLVFSVFIYAVGYC